MISRVDNLDTHLYKAYNKARMRNVSSLLLTLESVTHGTIYREILVFYDRFDIRIKISDDLSSTTALFDPS